jgi:acetylornithine deacetylase
MAVAYAHKGKQAWRCVAHGKAGHSAAPAKGINAIVPAARLIALIDGEARRLEDSRDAAFEPPYSTLHVGRISGGVAVNVIPERCEFDFEMRNIPGADADATIGRLRAEAAVLFPQVGAADDGCGFGFEKLSAYPALHGGNGASRAFLGWVRTLGRDGEAPRDATTLAFGSEGGLFEARLGIPVVVCGPGSIDDAHRPDEFVEREELARCCRFLEALAARIASNDLPTFFLSSG